MVYAKYKNASVRWYSTNIFTTIPLESCSWRRWKILFKGMNRKIKNRGPDASVRVLRGHACFRLHSNQFAFKFKIVWPGDSLDVYQAVKFFYLIVGYLKLIFLEFILKKFWIFWTHCAFWRWRIYWDSPYPNLFLDNFRFLLSFINSINGFPMDKNGLQVCMC